MKDLILNGVNLEPYMPARFSDDKKEQLFTLTQSISESVNNQIPIGFSYNEHTRLVLPHSLFAQQKTHATVHEVKKPLIGTKMRFFRNGARKAIGMDAYQELTTANTLQEGWRTYHLDRINDLRLLSREELNRAFELFQDDEELFASFTSKEDFVKNWNHWFRTFLAQSQAKYDLK